MSTRKKQRGGITMLVWLACFPAAGTAPAQVTEVVLDSFTGLLGAQPYAGVIRFRGSLYGTTNTGGTGNQGVVYKLDTTGHETVLYNFTGGPDGGAPGVGLAADSAGNLYGATHFGGTANRGVVFKVDPAGNETVLYAFTGGADGGYPNSGVTRDSGGNLYGTAYSGGVSDNGVVYKLDTSGNQTILHNFMAGSDGFGPTASVTLDAAGNLYGTTFYGGPAGTGVVYKLSPAGDEKVLYTFTGGTDGGFPYAGVVRDRSGNLYGTATTRGAAGGGVVYKLDVTGQQTVLHAFTGGADGDYPDAGVILDSAGSLYGVTYYGGPANAGIVFKVDSAGNETVLYTFTGGHDGAHPIAGLIRDPHGNLYGTTWAGGKFGLGAVFEIKGAAAEETPPGCW